MIKERDTTIGYHCPFCGMSILNRVNIFAMNENFIKMKCVCGGSELTVQWQKDRKYKITVPCILCPSTHSYTLSSKIFFQKDLFPFSCKFTAVDICFIGKSNMVFEAMKKNEEELMKIFASYDDEAGSESEGPDGEFGEFTDDYDYDDYDDYDESGDFGEDFGADDWEPGFILHKTGQKPFSGSEPEKQNESDINELNIEDIDKINGQIPVHLRLYQITEHILEAVSKLCEKNRIFCKCGDFDGKIILAGNAVHLECKNCGAYRDIKSATASDAEYLYGLKELYLDDGR